MTKLDGRSAYSKVVKIHDELEKDYKPGVVFTHEVIEYLMLTLYGFGDNRTQRKYFDLMEKGQLIIRHPKGRPKSIKRTITKQKTNKDTLEFHTYTGEQYCWSHYTLGSFPLKPRSPPAPLHNNTNELGVYLDGNVSKNMCVRVEGKELDGNTSLDRVNDGLQPLSSSDCEVGEKKERKNLLLYNNSSHTHISSNNLDSFSDSDLALIQRMEHRKELRAKGVLNLLTREPDGAQTP